VLPELVDDQVVDDSPALVGQQRVLGLAGREAVDIVRERALEQIARARPLHLELAHVRDVEDARVGPHGAVLRDDALVLDGHLPAGERHHPRPELDVPIVKRRVLERLGHAQARS
jgi:hypothetical protein